MHNYIFDAAVKHLAEFFGTGEHVLRAKIEELKDNNCPLFR